MGGRAEAGAADAWRPLLPARALLLLSAVLVAWSGGCAAAAVPAARCGGRRRLAQAQAPGASPVIEMVEVDVVSQECVMISNSYYVVRRDEGVEEVVSPWANAQETARDCCASCHDNAACNAFQWCPLEGGCSAPNGTAFPYRGCQLIDLSRFLKGSVNTGQLKMQGPDVPFMAGSPLFFSVPKLPGYDVEIGRNFGGKFNYSCPFSEVPGVCVMFGSAQELKGACDADAQCLAFSFYPSGSDSWPTDRAFGVLKGGESVQLTSADTELNPNAAIYLKLQQPGADAGGYAGFANGTGQGAGTGDGDGGGGASTAVIAAVASVAGVAVVAAVVAAAFWLRSRQRKAAVADDDKLGGGGGGEAGGGEADGELATAGSGSSRRGDGGSPLALRGGGDGASSSSSHDDGGPLGAASLGSGGGGKRLSRTLSPPSVVPSSGEEPEFSPFMVLPAAEPAGDELLHAAGSGAPPHAAWQPGGDGGVVVEVARAADSGAAAAEPPGSTAAAGNARELLEVFARMYSQRPAVDYAVVAQMLDEEREPGAEAADEAADEAALAAVDAEAAARRSASRSGSRGGAAAEGQRLEVVVEVAQQQHPQQHAQQPPPAQQQPHDEWAAVAALAAQQWQQAAASRGSSVEDRGSLLPGMVSPPASGAPPPPPSTEWSLQPEEVEICKRPDGSYWQLGTGAFGTCYKGLYHGRQRVAVKVLHRLEERRRGEEFEREVALLKDLRHRHIVQFIGACLDSPAPMLVTEWMEFGDLWRALPLKNATGQRIFAWGKRGQRVLADVARGLCYLHQRRIVHLDLKSANILLSRHGTAKICDIGMARVLGNKEYLSLLSGMGTFAWSAPEVLSGRRCTEKVDVYSFGVVMWEVCTGDVPMRGEMRPLRALLDCPPEVAALHERCTAERPEDRPTAEEVLAVLESQL